MNEDSKDAQKTATQSGSANKPRTFSSTDLLQGSKEIFISHGEETYRLRLTRNGKLILHK